MAVYFASAWCTGWSFLVISPELPDRRCHALWYGSANTGRRVQQAPRAGLEIDWSDPDTLTAVAGGVLGLLVGIGAPLFYISRDEIDEKRLEELRELNRQTFKETGEYLSEVNVLMAFKGRCRMMLLHTAPLLVSTSSVVMCRRRSRHSASQGGQTGGKLVNKSHRHGHMLGIMTHSIRCDRHSDQYCMLQGVPG